MNRLMFLALLCALLIPRVAWAAHISADDQSRPASVSHVHHDGHSHVVVHSEDDGSREGDSPDSHGGLAHNHLPADVLSVMGQGDPGLQDVEISFARSTHSLDRRSDRPPTEAPDSLLRPPRTA